MQVHPPELELKAAIVRELGLDPVYGDFADPTPSPGKSVIRVRASAISHLTKGRASGRHYSAGHKPPFVPGVDGTGIAADGRRVYFMFPEHPYGAMAELCVVNNENLVPLPTALSEVSAAAMAIPGMSSWAALSERANLRSGETVLVNGATGSSGRLAVQIAKHLGAKKVIVTGRQTQALEELRLLGADACIQLVQDTEALKSAFETQFREGVDIILDYLWGMSADALLSAAAQFSLAGMPIRFVQIGSISGEEVSLKASLLRSSGLQLMGSGIGSVPFPKLLGSIQGVLAAATSAGFKLTTERRPLAEVTDAWAAGGSDSRIVLVP